MNKLSENRKDEFFGRSPKLSQKELEWCEKRFNEIVRDLKKRLSEKKENEKL